MRTKRTRPTMIALLTALVVPALSACGGDSNGAAQAQELTEADWIDACGLLTVEEVEAASGMTVSETMKDQRNAPNRDGTVLFTTCIYDVGSIDDNVSVTVRQFPVAGAAIGSEQRARALQEDYDRQRSDPNMAGMMAVTFSAVDIPGHAAVIADWTDFQILEVFLEETGQIQLSVAAPEATVAVELAKTALARL